MIKRKKWVQNGVWTMRNNDRQYTKGISALIIVSGEHEIKCETAECDLRKIAKAADVEMLKTARIHEVRGFRKQQETGMRELNKMLQVMRDTEEKRILIEAGILAAGYANGMNCAGLMTKSELHDVIEVIDQAFVKAEQRINDVRRPLRAYFKRKRRVDNGKR